MSGFTLFPAIDLLSGAAVRLHQGDYEQKTVYDADPLAVAARFFAAKAQWLHVVDLDGAKSGTSENRDAIAAIVRLAGECGARVQVGGGIRDVEAVERWLELGVARCVIGTRASDLNFMQSLLQHVPADAVVAGLDGRDGKLATHGWVTQTEVSLVSLASQLATLGVRHAIVTDVLRDGTSSGPNLDLAAAIQTTGIGAIASGGIRDAADVIAARSRGLAGAIAGRAIYTGGLDVASTLLALARQATARMAREGNTC